MIVVAELAEALASTLQNLGRFEEAAQISLTYLNAPRAAIISLVRGCMWAEALRLVCQSRETSE